MAKAAKPKARAPLIVCEYGEFVIVYFSREVIEDGETLRRLAHRVVDLRVDKGRDKWLHDDVAESLAHVAQERATKEATAFGPEGKMLVSGDQEGIVKVWLAHTGKEVHSLNAAQDVDRRRPKGSARAKVAFSRTGDLVAAASGPSTTLWSVETTNHARR